MNIGWRTKYILALSEDFFNAPLEALRNHGPSPWFSFPQKKTRQNNFGGENQFLLLEFKVVNNRMQHFCQTGNLF